MGARRRRDQILGGPSATRSYLNPCASASIRGLFLDVRQEKCATDGRRCTRMKHWTVLDVSRDWARQPSVGVRSDSFRFVEHSPSASLSRRAPECGQCRIVFPEKEICTNRGAGNRDCKPAFSRLDSLESESAARIGCPTTCAAILALGKLCSIRHSTRGTRVGFGRHRKGGSRQPRAMRRRNGADDFRVHGPVRDPDG